MGNFDTEFITSVLIFQDTYISIRILVRDILIRYVRQYCAKHGISNRIFRNKFVKLIAEAVEEARFRCRKTKVY